MRRILIILFAVSILMSLPIWISAARDEALKPVPDSMKVGFDSITKEDAYNYVDFLACDELEGRDTGMRGMRIARRYVASLYSLWGLKPAGDKEGEGRSYHQLIDMMEIVPGGESYIEVRKGNATSIHRNGEDVFSGRGGAGSAEIEAPVVFVGYGISAPELGYDDLAGVDLKGKIALVISGTPGAANPDSPFNKPENSRRYSGYMYTRTMNENFTKLGAVGVLTVGQMFRPGQTKAWSDDYKQGSRIDSPRRSVTIPALTDFGGSMTSMRVGDGVADELLAAGGTSLADVRDKIDSSLKPASLNLDGVTVKIHTETNMKPFVSGNVIGMIEGSDPELKNEAVIIGAHLDHEGINAQGYVFNGADDNASGSAGVLEAAQAFALNPVKPKRSVIFACWTGEEKGLYGSRYFVQCPTMPDVKIIACLNMDMISRDWDPERLKAMGNRMGGSFASDIEINDQTIKRIVTASASGQCPEFKEIIERMNKQYVGTLLSARSSNELSGGSDHAPFHMNKIPASMFFAAMTDDYHQPGDTADKMNNEKMQDIIRLVYLTAFEIADADETITWTEPEK